MQRQRAYVQQALPISPTATTITKRNQRVVRSARLQLNVFSKWVLGFHCISHCKIGEDEQLGPLYTTRGTCLRQNFMSCAADG